MSEPFTTEITESDQQGLRSVLDAALKQAGLPALPAVSYFTAKFRLLEQVPAPTDLQEPTTDESAAVLAEAVSAEV
jgi:hypothetical protein